MRWLWKIDGLIWHISNPTREYSSIHTLRERVLRPLDAIRGKLILAVALCANVNPKYGDSPMGLDSDGAIDGIFVSGVFSRTALMVALKPFEALIPPQFSSYHLAPKGDEPCADAKLFYPKISVPTDTELVGMTWVCSRQLSAAHAAFSRQYVPNT